MTVEKIQNIKKENGFTLIEVLITSVITVILGGAIISVIYLTTQTRLSAFNNLTNVDQTNLLISQMERELRNVRPADNGAYSLVVVHDQEIVFYSDIDYDGITEKVRYTLDGTEFTKGVIKPTGYPAVYDQNNEKQAVLTNDVKNGSTPIFYYYNGDWPEDTTNNPLAEPVRLSDTKLIKLHLELNNSDSGDNFILESSTQLRMLKQNL